MASVRNIVVIKAADKDKDSVQALVQISGHVEERCKEDFNIVTVVIGENEKTNSQKV